MMAVASSVTNHVPNERPQATRLPHPLFYFVPIRALRALRVSAHGPKARSHGQRDAKRLARLAKTWTKNCRSLAPLVRGSATGYPPPHRNSHTPPQPIRFARATGPRFAHPSRESHAERAPARHRLQQWMGFRQTGFFLVCHGQSESTPTISALAFQRRSRSRSSCTRGSGSARSQPSKYASETFAASGAAAR
jgi:hypothetical protein